jgi:hypothetical protein
MTHGCQSVDVDEGGTFCGEIDLERECNTTDIDIMSIVDIMSFHGR